MFNKLLPFTLIASFALPFLAKADESQSPVEQQPATQALTKQQTDFMTLVAAAVYIEKYKSEESTPIKAFLNATREEILKNNTISNNSLSLFFASRNLDAQLMQQLEEKYLNEEGLLLLEKNKENGKSLIMVSLALAVSTRQAAELSKILYKENV